MATIAGVPVAIVHHPRARRVRLSFDTTRRVLRLSLPRRASLARALAWAQGQGAWVETQLSGLSPQTPFADRAVIPFLGDDVTIRHDSAARRGCRLADGVLWVGGPVEVLAAAVERWLRAQALALLGTDTADFAGVAGVTVERVAIGSARSRWGSCTASGTIRYNWRLVLAPPFVRRATAAHEVAHRLHMNHSPAFHAAVARIADTPDADARSRAWLRANGARLHGIGKASPASSE